MIWLELKKLANIAYYIKGANFMSIRDCDVCKMYIKEGISGTIEKLYYVNKENV